MNFTIIDISKSLNNSPVYPGDPVPKLEVFSSISAGDLSNMALLTTALHSGTHADAPLHFINGAADIGSVDLGPFIGECVVLEVNQTVITGRYVNEHFPPCERLLLKSGGKAYFDKTGAEEAAFMGIKLIGTDNMSVGCPEDQTGPHRALLGEGVNIIENLDLSAVKPGKYFLLSQPVKINGVEASPVRAVLLDGYLFWSK